MGREDPLEKEMANAMDRGAWWSSGHGDAKSWTRLSDFTHTHQCIYMEFRKMVMINLYVRQQKRHRCKELSLDSVGKSDGGMI